MTSIWVSAMNACYLIRTIITPNAVGVNESNSNSPITVRNKMGS